MSEDAPQPPARCAALYRPQRVLGTGGHATVWLGEQVALSRPVAIKVLHRDHLADPALVARFREEARITAALAHPHIVVVIDHDVESGVPWIVYEFIPGRSLRDRLTHARFSVADALEAAAQIASALAAAHQAGVLHRDIKPENVLEAAPGRYKVSDFGIARWTAAGRPHTATGVILGTPAYLAPEQIQSGGTSPATDLYALGVTLHELIAGEPPYGGETIYQVLERHVRAEVPSLRALRPDVPEPVDRLVRALLAKSPADRPASAAAAAEALRAAREALAERPPGDDRRVAQAVTDPPETASGAGQRRRATDRTAPVSVRITHSAPALEPPRRAARTPAIALATAALAAGALLARAWLGAGTPPVPPSPTPSASATVADAPPDAEPAPRAVPLEPAMRTDLLASLNEVTTLYDRMIALVKAHDRTEDALGIDGFEGNTIAAEFATGKPARVTRREWLSGAKEAADLRAAAPPALRLADLFKQISARPGTELLLQAPLADALGLLMEVLWNLGLDRELEILHRVVQQSAAAAPSCWMPAFAQAREGQLAAQAGRDSDAAESRAKLALTLLEREARGAGPEAASAPLHARVLILFALREIYRATHRAGPAADRENECRALLAWPWPAGDPTGLAARTYRKLSRELGAARPAK